MRRKEAGFIAAQAAIFVGVIALVSLPIQSTNEQQVSTSSALAGSLAFTSGVSPQGLQLEVTLNASSVQSHGAVSARVEAFNTLDRNVSLSGLAQNQNILEWSGDDYVCDSPSTIVGFALFRGHFAAGNISAAGQPLQLAPPEVFWGCGYFSSPVAVTFLPEGDQAVATDVFQSSGPVTVSVNATTGDCGDNPELGGLCTGKGLSGYWNDSIPAPGALNFTSPAFVYFPPGEYTIAATDLWDQYVYATFAVQSPLETSNISTVTANPADGFPRNAAGGWDIGYVGSDPNPIGCNFSLGSTFGEGYSLSVYSEYDAVKAGDLVCISIVLVNMNGTTVTYGDSSKVETGFNVTDSSGKLVFQDSCIPDGEPPNPQGRENAVRKVFECGAVWDTGVASAAGVTPTPGTYTITAIAAYPGTPSQPPVVAITRESVNFTVLPGPAG
jgi:hypothetical protein